MKVKVVRRAAVVGVATLFAVAGLGRAQVLEQLPADSLVVFRVKSLSQVSQKAATLSKQLGLAAMSPDMADPLKALEAKLGISKGLNRDGDLAFAYVDPAVTNAGEKSLLILVPVTDYQAFLGNFADADTDGDISAVTTPEGEPAFVKSWGKYAAISPARETLSAKAAGVTVQGALAKKELGEKDVVMFANLAALRKTLLPQLKNNREKWLAEMEKDMLASGRRIPANDDAAADPNDPAAADEAALAQQAQMKRMVPVARAAANQAMNVAEAFLRDAQSATYSINLTDAGINGTLQAEFEPGSYVGKAVAGLKGTNGPLLAGLPAGKYLMFGGASVDPKAMAQVLADVVDPVVKELGTLGDNGAAVQKYADALKAYTNAAGEQTFGLVAPTGALGQESIVQMIAITRGDAKAVQAAQRDMFQSQQGLMKLVQPDDAAAAPYKTTYTAAAKQIDGVTFDQFQTEFNLGQTPQEQQAAQMMAMLYGPNGMTGYTGLIDDKQLLSVSGASDAIVSGAIKAAKGNQDVLSGLAPVKLVAGELPQNRIAAIYVPVDVILGTGINYAKQFGMPVNVQLDENLPPVGLTVAADGTALRFDSHVPTPLIQSVTNAVMQVYMGMQGGGDGAQPGPNDGGL